MGIQPHPSDALGNSGPGWPMPTDDRPECSPASALYDLIDLLHGAGLVFEPAPNQLHVAAIAMADVLRAIGIRPVTAPERRR